MKNTFRFLILTVPFLAATNVLVGQWVQTNCPCGEINALAVSGGYLFAAGQLFLPVGTVNLVFTSFDDGKSWNHADSGLPGTKITCFAVIGQNVFAGTGESGIYRSTNNGTSWTAVDSGLTELDVTCLTANGPNIFAGTGGGAIFLSANNGVSWTALGSSITNWDALAIAVIGSNLFAGTWDNGVFRSTNNGTNWNSVNNGLANTHVSSLAVVGTNLFAGTFGGGVFLSNNNGTNWVNVGLTDITIGALAVSGKNLFAGSESEPLAGVYVSTNNGINWSAVDTGLALGDGDTLLLNPLVGALAVSDTNIFAGTNAGLFRRPLSEMVTSVRLPLHDLPTVFTLEQNYPNPFNPSTTISFKVPAKSFVTLKLFDVLGREVSILASEELSAGTYSRQWNASSFPSGVYFYRIQAGSFTETKKCILVK